MTIISAIIFWAFVVWATVQAFYAIYFYSRILFYKNSPARPAHEKIKPVSLIICAKNEAHNLTKNLPAILSQKYYDTQGNCCYEVIVVDDGSLDDSGAVLAALQQKYPHLKKVTIPANAIRTFKGKKYPLSIGAANAAHNYLLLTDADCLPASDLWLATMVAPLMAGKEIVAGHGAYTRRNTLLNAFIRWETVNSFIQGCTYAMAGKPYLAVGRNMACTKAILLKGQQSSIWDISASGDDDLLVNLYGTPENYTMITDARAFTYTDTPHTFKDWIKQKQRHLTDGKSYRSNVKYWLSTYGFTHAALWVYFIALLFTPYCLPATCIMAARCGTYWFLWAIAALHLKEKKLIFFLPFFDIGWMIFNIAFSPYIILKNKQHWK